MSVDVGDIVWQPVSVKEVELVSPVGVEILVTVSDGEASTLTVSELELEASVECVSVSEVVEVFETPRDVVTVSLFENGTESVQDGVSLPSLLVTQKERVSDMVELLVRLSVFVPVGRRVRLAVTDNVREHAHEW